MLLPQELDVLDMIKNRAKDRRKRQERIKNLRIFGILFVILLLFAAILSIKFRQKDELKSPSDE